MRQKDRTQPLSVAAAIAAGAPETSRQLTSGEISLAQSIFGPKINYAQVHIFHEGAYFFQPNDRLIAPDGNIYATPNSTVYSTNYSSVAFDRSSLIQTCMLFIHEMTHVWQYQIGMFVKTRRTLGFEFRYFYDHSKLGTRDFKKYGIEQQATIVEDFYFVKNGHAKIDKNGVPIQMPSLQTFQKVTSPYFP